MNQLILHVFIPCVIVHFNMLTFFIWDLQKQFSELLMKAASDYGLLTSSVADFQWTQNFKEPPSVWGVCLSTLLAYCTRSIFYSSTNSNLKNYYLTKIINFVLVILKCSGLSVIKFLHGFDPCNINRAINPFVNYYFIFLHHLLLEEDLHHY